ncbi:MAG: DUF2892 domain-containing protein [Thermodesulfobacteriota bacterium]
MNSNVSSVDKVVRIIIALVLFSLYFVLEGNLRYLAVIGFIPLLTALISWCPIYKIFGLNSCPLNKN